MTDETPQEERKKASGYHGGNVDAVISVEEVNRQAFADQARKIEELGGLEAIRAMPSFNHTPIDLD